MNKLTKILFIVLGIVAMLNSICIMRNIYNEIKISKDLSLESVNSITILATQVRKLKDEIVDIKNNIPNEINKINNEKKLNREQLEKKMLNGSVTVYSIRQKGMGSGTIIKKTSNSMYILTCYHVIADYFTEKNVTPLEKITIGYDTVVYAVDIIKTDEAQDLALLKAYVNDPSLEEIKLSSIKPKKGDTVYIVGNPMGSMRNISVGILSNYVEEMMNNVLRKIYVVDALCVFGNSGGSLYNENAELIGVPSNVPGYGLGSVVTNMGICISLDSVRDFLKELM